MTRWKHRMLFGALAVLAPALVGCEAGFNAPTLEYHPAAFGAYASKNGVSISNAFVLGPSPSGPEVAGGRAGVFLAISCAGRGQAGLGQRAGHRVRRADPRRTGPRAGRGAGQPDRPGTQGGADRAGQPAPRAASWSRST